MNRLQESIPRRASELASPDRRHFVIPAIFALVFVVVAFAVQMTSPVPPWNDAAPIDFFTAALLWMLSLLSLSMANQRLTDRWRLLLWMACCAGFAALAIDEPMEYHERTRRIVGDDDHIKAAAWVFSGFALWLLSRIERLPRVTTALLATGYCFHTCYITVDVGDGDYFKLPIDGSSLQWAEECFELFSLTCYMLAFLFLHGIVSRAFVAVPLEPRVLQQPLGARDAERLPASPRAATRQAERIAAAIQKVKTESKS